MSDASTTPAEPVPTPEEEQVIEPGPPGDPNWRGTEEMVQVAPEEVAPPSPDPNKELLAKARKKTNHGLVVSKDGTELWVLDPSTPEEKFKQSLILATVKGAGADGLRKEGPHKYFKGTVEQVTDLLKTYAD